MGVVHQPAEEKQRAEDVEDAAQRCGAEETHQITCGAVFLMAAPQ